jgi:hypothetical protein
MRLTAQDEETADYSTKLQYQPFEVGNIRNNIRKRREKKHWMIKGIK